MRGIGTAPDHRVEGEDVPPTPPVAGRRFFIGRGPELELLRGALDDAREGRGRFVALVGDAGIGKTRTLEEFVRRTELPDARVLWGRCPEHPGLPAYWPWTQAIERWVERCDAATLGPMLGQAAADLAQLMPIVAARLPQVEPPAPCDPAQSRLRLFDGVAGLLRRMAVAEPLVLVLDDLHWADEGSSRLLGFVAAELRRSQVLILGSYRERELRRRPAMLGEIARVSERLPLDGFGLEEVGEFVRNRNHDRASDAVIARLHGASQGNPFFLDELVRMLSAKGGLDDEDGMANRLLPDQVRHVIQRNLASLAAEDRAILEAAAVLGYDFDVGRLRALCDRSPDVLLERLHVLADAGVVEEVPDAGGRFRFAHVLVRDALYADLSPLDRARLHRRVGLALEALHEGVHEPPYAELAHHFVHAAVLGDAGKALGHATRAGEQALARLAYEEAVNHFEVALRMLRLESPDDARELQLRMRLGRAQACAGDHSRARGTFERAAERARALGDVATFADAALGYASAAPGVGSVYATLVALLDEALRMVDERDDALRATLLATLASALCFSRDERRHAFSRDAVATARRVGDPGVLANALVQRHYVLWGPGDVRERLALCDEIIRLTSDSGDLHVALSGRQWRLVDLLEAGDLPALDTELDAYGRIADRARIPMHRWCAGVLRATRAAIDGRLAESERLAHDAAALWPDGPVALPVQMLAVQRFLLYLETGRVTEVKEVVAEMARVYPAIPGWHAGVALIQMHGGDPDAARRILDSCAAREFVDLPRDFTFLSTLVTLALVAHGLRDTERASLVYAALVPYADRYVSIGMGAGTYGSCTRYLGLLALTMGRVDDAARHLEDALASNVALGSRPLVAHTQADYAEVLALRHERSRAQALLDQATRTAEQLGLTRLLARIDDVRAMAAGARPRVATGMFRRDGAHWTITYEGRTAQVKDAKGHGYLAALLQYPGRELHALDLEIPCSGGGRSPVDPGATTRRDGGGDAGELIDAQARSAYKRRLAELEEELEEARRFNDPGPVERCQREIESLTAELTRAIGLGGRHRKAASAAERARINVTRAISAAIRKIADAHPALGEHLAARVHTGTFCSYSPDPLVAVEWTL
jgi:tetratricopeptide (TPR) repeat protein